MARKNKKKDDVVLENMTPEYVIEDEPKSRVASIIITILIVLIWLGIFAEQGAIKNE